MILRWNHFSVFIKTEFSDIYAIYIQVPVREVPVREVGWGGVREVGWGGMALPVREVPVREVPVREVGWGEGGGVWWHRT